MTHVNYKGRHTSVCKYINGIKLAKFNLHIKPVPADSLIRNEKIHIESPGRSV